MPYIFTVLLLIISVITCRGNNVADDFSMLTRKSSEQLMSEGRRYFENRQPAKSLSCFQIVSNRYKPGDSREKAEYCVRALNNCGCVYKYFYYDYMNAYDYFTRAYELCELIGYDSFLPAILVNLGDLLNDYGSIYNSKTIRSQADSILNMCIDKAFETRDWELLTTAFFNLSNSRYDIDLKKYKSIFSKEIPDSTPDLRYIRLLYKGIENIQRKNYPEARRNFEQQFSAVSTRWQANRDTLATYMNIANTYELEKNYRQAARSLEQALPLARNDDMLDLSAYINKQLSEYYTKMGDTITAQRYRMAYLEKMEEVHNSQLSDIAELKYLSEIKKEEAKALELTQKQRTHRMIILVIVLVLLIVIAFTAFIFKQNRILQARNKSLYEKYNKATLQPEVNETEIKYSHSNLNDCQRESLVDRIKEVMSNPEIICQQGFSSKQLASLVNSNTTYVSQVINETYGVSFSILLGNYRVREACRRINESTQYDNLTIEGIANSVGFKSRTALLNAFKREVGITPSEYIKVAASEKKSQM